MNLKQILSFKKVTAFIFTIFCLNILCIEKINKKEKDSQLLSFEELMNTEVITASKITESLKEAPASIEIITEEQIKLRGYQCLDDIFRDISGFDLVHVNGTWPTIWAGRGLYGDENKRILLMIDGIAENNILEGSVLGGQQYSLHNVKQIEIMWGPGSAIYGANAFSGIINIITKNGEDISGIEYQQGFGSFGTHFEKLLAGFKKDDFSMALSSSLYNTDGPVFKERHPEYNNSYVNDAYSLSLKASYKNVTAGFFRYDRPMGDGEFSNSPTVFGYGLPTYGFDNNEGIGGGDAQTDMNGEKGTRWHSVTETGYIKHTDSTNHLTFNSSIYYRNTGIDNDSYYYDFNGEEFTRYQLMHDSWLVGIESFLNFNLDETNNLTAGFQYEKSNVEKGYREMLEDSNGSFYTLDSTNRKKVIYKNTALSMQYKHQFQNINSSFIAGIRYDINNIYENNLNPRVGFVINTSPATTIKLLYGKAFRAPNNFELYTETTIRIPNPNLKSENANSYSLNLSHIFSTEFSFSFSIFYNNFDNLIVSNVNIGDITGDGIENTMNLNISSAQIEGIDAKLEYNYNNYNIFCNFTFQNAHENLIIESSKIQNKIPNIANFKANIGINYTNHIGNLYVIGNYVGNRSTSITNPLEKVDNYFLVNLNFVSQSTFENRVNIFIKIENIFDTEWEDPGIRSATGSYYGTTHTQPGRTSTVGFTLKF